MRLRRRRCRGDIEPRTVQLSINRDGHKERAQQVQLMRRIYSEVCVITALHCCSRKNFVGERSILGRFQMKLLGIESLYKEVWDPVYLPN
jgi:hypothetical protein